MYEELIRALREHADKKCVAFKGAHACGSNLALEAADAIEELSHEIDIDNAAMTAMDAAMPRWIPVTKRLPEPETEVMVAFDDGEVWCVLQNWTAQDEADKPTFYMTDPFTGAGHTVTHWMPLPSAEGLNET